MDPWDSHVGRWTIKGWATHCQDPAAPKFPDNGFLQDGELIVVKAGGGVNLFWPDGNQMPCCVHFSDLSSVPSSLASFAGVNITCTGNDRSFDRQSKVLTVVMTVCPGENGEKVSTGNTGTFVAQAVPPPPPCREPGR